MEKRGDFQVYTVLVSVFWNHPPSSERDVWSFRPYQSQGQFEVIIIECVLCSIVLYCVYWRPSGVNYQSFSDSVKSIVFTLHYITLHYITSFHTPVTPKVTNGSSTKSLKFFECELEKVSFQKFFESINELCQIFGISFISGSIQWIVLPCRLAACCPIVCHRLLGVAFVQNGCICFS